MEYRYSTPSVRLRRLLSLALIITLKSIFVFADTVELEWNPNAEANLTGYYVYRSQNSSAGFVRLNAIPVSAPIYDDTDAVSGQTYYYVVTAVNDSGQESGFSEPFQVVVSSSNRAPQAVSDTAAVLMNASGQLNVLVNDSDPDGDPLSVVSVTSNANISATILSASIVRFTPALLFTGVATFTYTVSDGRGGLDTATVTVTVVEPQGPNLPPVASDDSAGTDEDLSVLLEVLSNDLDPDSNPLRVSAVTSPDSGIVTINANNSLTYIPDENFFGSDSFAYTADDGLGGSDTATVTILVASVNDEPDVVDDDLSAQFETPIVIDALANDSDVDGDSLSIYLITEPGKGTASINPDNSLTFQPNAGACGPDRFSYFVHDGNGGNATGDVNVWVEPPGNVPVARNDSSAVNEDAPITLNVVANDCYPAGTPPIPSFVSDPENGRTSLNQNGSVTYAPDPDYYGTDSFVYGYGGEVATVTITVIAVNDTPEVDAGEERAVREGVEVLLRGEASDTDDEELTYRWVQITGPDVILRKAQTATPTFQAPTNDLPATLVFQFSANDGLRTANDRVTVRVVSSQGEPLFFPSRVSGLLNSFVGIALVNSRAAPEEVLLTGLSAGGTATGVPSVVLGPNGQIAFPTDKFEAYLPDLSALVVEGTQGSLQGFFLVGGNELQRLDGVGSQLRTSEKLVFPLARSGDGEETFFFIFNPGIDREAQVRLRLTTMEGTGSAEMTISIPPSGNSMLSISEILPGEAHDGILTVISDVPVQAIAFYEQGDNLAAFAGQVSERTEEFVVPHFYSEPRGGTTRLRLVNTGNQATTVTIEAFDDSSLAIGEAELSIAPGRTVDSDVRELFGLDPELLVSGFLRLSMGSPLGILKHEIVGAVIFSGNEGKQLSALPMLRTSNREFIFPQVAQSTELGLFTGLAVYNDSDLPADLELEVYDQIGNLAADTTVRIQPGRKLVDLLNGDSFLGPSFSLVNGHFRIRSSQPVFAFALFGNFDRDFLASIEGQIPVFLEEE